MGVLASYRGLFKKKTDWLDDNALTVERDRAHQQGRGFSTRQGLAAA
jgi:hypothetical protein